MRPSTGLFQIAVHTVWSPTCTGRGSPTLTDSTTPLKGSSRRTCCLRRAHRALVTEVQLDPRDAAFAHRVDETKLHLQLGLLSPRPAADGDERDDAVADRTEEVD